MKNYSRQDIIKMIKGSEHVYIYGAGAAAKRILSIIETAPYELKIEAAVVTKIDDKTQVTTLPVIEINSLSAIDDKTLFIVSVGKKYQEEVVETLKGCGYNRVLIWNDSVFRKLSILTPHSFIDRRRKAERVCFVLCGYKEFLWDSVFDRLIRFVPDDVEICLLTSGLWDDRINRIAEEKGWSYISTVVNNVCLIQNVAYELFDTTEWIYKMDEDIFVTNNCFDRLMDVYKRAELESDYKVGLVSPMIPLNGQGYIRILDILNKREEYENRFERVLFGGFPKRKLESDPEVARFMWGEGGIIPQVDELNELVKDRKEYSVCSVRLSIGFILFRRSFWEDFGHYPNTGTSDLGKDEWKIGEYCMSESRAMFIAENCVCGHFSFGSVTSAMKEFYNANREYFDVRGDQ